MLLPAVCLAEPPGPPEGPPPGKPGQHREPPPLFDETWKTADADLDGFISREEFAAMPRVQNLPEEKRTTIFDRLDKDDDGKLSREELMRFGRPRDGEPAKKFWELDADKSGGISFEEFKLGPFFKKLPPEKISELFERLDTDNDGIITPKDRPEMPFKRGDGKSRNKGDGHRGGDGPEKAFEKLDANGDGSLSFGEFRTGPEVSDLSEEKQKSLFQRLDSDGDGRISIKDCPPPPPRPDRGGD